MFCVQRSSRGLVLLVLLAVLAWPSFAAAQMSARVRGVIMDVDGEPVEGASVTFKFQGGVTREQTATTNDEGEYMQMGLQNGPYIIVAAKDGVGERTEELQKEVDEGHDEVDKHKRLSGEMAAQCDDLKTLVAAGAAQLETTTTERDTLQVSVEEVTQSLQKVTGERQSAEARLAEAIQSAKAAAKAHAGALKSETETHATALEGEKEAHASALKGETEKRARVDKELSEARDQFNAQS